MRFFLSKFMTNSCVLMLCFTVSANAQNYYIDSVFGNDTNNGATSDQAWASLQRVNQHTFQPGDQLFIKAGTTYTGQLKPIGSGTQQQPIVITQYGEGAKPRIDGNGVLPAALWLHNVEHYHVSNLQITNQGEQPTPGRNGVRVSLKNFGTAHNITLSHLDVSDVNGSCKRFEKLNAGISYYNIAGEIPSRFDGLIIEHCTIQNVDRDGIKGRSDYWKRTIWHPNLNIIIRYNNVTNVAGDGIVPYGCEDARVEHNTVTYARQRTDESAVGIWPWSCDRTVIQYNEVGYTKGNHDGQGFDADFNCQQTLIQYNYSHHNDGGFVLICNSKMPMPQNIGNHGTIIRYNISYNDGTPEENNRRGPIFVFSGGTNNTQIYNNLIYLDKPTERLMVNVWGTEEIGFPDNVLFANNVFHVADTAEVNYNIVGMTQFEFSNNIYAGIQKNLPVDLKAIQSSELPLDFNTQTPTLNGLQSNNVVIPTSWLGEAAEGLPLPETDFRGTVINSNTPRNIGPWQ